MCCSIMFPFQQTPPRIQPIRWLSARCSWRLFEACLVLSSFFVGIYHALKYDLFYFQLSLSLVVIILKFMVQVFYLQRVLALMARLRLVSNFCLMKKPCFRFLFFLILFSKLSIHVQDTLPYQYLMAKPMGGLDERYAFELLKMA